eukprot:TRINITY_DN20233_c0_g1::TRINITY_DN20233_c0_g1_i1::g.30368::m.30368 TRINITY_DN20233_c0_g1::TRINITY_DN20233_c0_g1_i1::g.30368  ORF type:complete len:120 (+),score=8.93 TRINITY_DN20233_c0_g1_i1:44-361(+)
MSGTFRIGTWIYDKSTLEFLPGFGIVLGGYLLAGTGHQWVHSLFYGKPKRMNGKKFDYQMDVRDTVLESACRNYRTDNKQPASPTSTFSSPLTAFLSRPFQPAHH